MYFLLFAYLLILIFLSEKISMKKVFILTLIPLILVIWLRYGVGADYFSYKRIYLDLKELSFMQLFSNYLNIDILYKFLSFIPAKLGINFHIYSSILISVFLLLLMKWISDYPIKFEIAMLLYVSMLFFYWNLSALRQGIVVIVSLYIYFNGSRSYSNKEMLLTTTILFFIHKSAIIVPVLYFLSSFKWTKKKFGLFLIFAPMSRLLVPLGIVNVITNIPILSNLTRYLDFNSISYISAPSLMRLTFIIIVLISLDVLYEKFPEYRKMFNFSLISLIGYFYLPFAMVVGTRTTIFGFFLLVIILPMIFDVFSEDHYGISLIVLLSISIFSFTNEYMKLVDRTGYVKNPLCLNFETIFNSDYKNFDNRYALKMSIDRDMKEWYKGTALEERINLDYSSANSTYSDENEHFTVYIPKVDAYGIINNKGELVFDYFYTGHREIYRNYRLVNFFAGPFSISDFEDFSLSPSKFKSYEEVREEILVELQKVNDYNYSSVQIESISIESLNDYELFSVYNWGTVVLAEKYTYAIDESVSYIRLSTDVDVFYLILKNGTLMTDRIYEDIEVQNSKKIIIAYTASTKEYINNEGEVVWYEEID